MFSVADHVLMRPLPFPDDETLVRVVRGSATGPWWLGLQRSAVTRELPNFTQQTSSFEAFGAFQRDAVNVVDGGEPQRLAIARTTAEVLPLLRVPPVLGVVFDPGAPDLRTAVIGYALWQARFGGDPRVLGRTLNLDGSPHTVIGVMPAGFYFPTRDVQLTPLRFTDEDFATRGNSLFEAVGRLRPGVTFEQARADLDVVVERLARAYIRRRTKKPAVSFFRMRVAFRRGSG